MTRRNESCDLGEEHFRLNVKWNSQCKETKDLEVWEGESEWLEQVMEEERMVGNGAEKEDLKAIVEFRF